MRRIKEFAAFLVVFTAGCSADAPVEPIRAIILTSVDTLRPGQTAVLRGSGLSGVHSIRLDGVQATELVVRSDSVAEFRVPSIRACETDMREVKVSAEGSLPINAIVRVEPNVSLRAGESRVLTEADLQCLRLPSADEDYVLSAANVAMPTASVESPRTLLTIRVRATDATSSVLTSSLASSATHANVATFSAQRAVDLVEPAPKTTAALTGSYSSTPLQFDPRYATAVVGDTLRFVDWYAADAETICNAPAESVPSFKAKVIAISGSVVVVVDLRHPYASAYVDPAPLGWLRDGAAMTDHLLLPTMRSLFSPDYVPPAGGGGRYFVMLRNLPGALQGFTGYAYDGPLPAVNVMSQVKCARASEMVVTSIAPEKLAGTASDAASIFLHEYAHNADLLTSGRDRTASILNEGLATLAQETASRIASGQPIGAVHSHLGSDAPLPASAAFGLWGTAPELGPWQTNGRYGTNARMLMFLRELTGEASVNHGRSPTFYQRLISAPIDWLNGLSVIANVLSTAGIGYEDLIDRQTLASVTAGLIDPTVVHNLPRYTSWDHSERAHQSGPLSQGFPGRASRRYTAEYTLTAADGAHAALYLMGDGARAISLEAVSTTKTSRIIRLTRLR